MRLLGDESLQEFLVKIGWNLDELGYDKVNDLIDSLFKKITGKAGNTVNSIIKGAGIVIDAIEGITEATVGLITKTAQLDNETEKWARRYWTTEQNARSLQSAMQAMGLSSLDDLYYSTNEEYNRFLELKNLGKSLEAPKELDNFLVKIRDIQHEFNKLKVIFSYGARWVVYYLGQIFGKDTEEILQDFKNLVSWFGNNIPKISEKIARALSHVINIVLALYNVGKNIYEFVSGIFDKLPTKTKVMLAAISALLIAFLAGPVGRIIAGITLLLLLLEDYYVWTKGGKSLFDYSKINEFFNSDEMEGFKRNVGIIVEGFGDLLDLIIQLLSVGVPEFFKELNDTFESICTWLEKIITYLNLLSGKTGDVEQDSWIGRGINAANAAAEAAGLNDESWMNKNPLLQPPDLHVGSFDIVDNSSVDVKVDIKYDKASDTFEVAREILRNTNYSSPITAQ